MDAAQAFSASHNGQRQHQLAVLSEGCSQDVVAAFANDVESGLALLAPPPRYDPVRLYIDTLLMNVRLPSL